MEPMIAGPALGGGVAREGMGPWTDARHDGQAGAQAGMHQLGRAAAAPRAPGGRLLAQVRHAAAGRAGPRHPARPCRPGPHLSQKNPKLGRLLAQVRHVAAGPQASSLPPQARHHNYFKFEQNFVNFVKSFLT